MIIALPYYNNGTPLEDHLTWLRFWVHNFSKLNSSAKVILCVTEDTTLEGIPDGMSYARFHLEPHRQSGLIRPNVVMDVKELLALEIQRRFLDDLLICDTDTVVRKDPVPAIEQEKLRASKESVLWMGADVGRRHFQTIVPNGGEPLQVREHNAGVLFFPKREHSYERISLERWRVSWKLIPKHDAKTFIHGQRCWSFIHMQTWGWFMDPRFNFSHRWESELSNQINEAVIMHYHGPQGKIKLKALINA